MDTVATFGGVDDDGVDHGHGDPAERVHGVARDRAGAVAVAGVVEPGMLAGLVEATTLLIAM